MYKFNDKITHIVARSASPCVCVCAMCILSMQLHLCMCALHCLAVEVAVQKTYFIIKSGDGNEIDKYNSIWDTHTHSGTVNAVGHVHSLDEIPQFEMEKNAASIGDDRESKIRWQNICVTIVFIHIAIVNIELYGVWPYNCYFHFEFDSLFLFFHHSRPSPSIQYQNFTIAHGIPWFDILRCISLHRPTTPHHTTHTLMHSYSHKTIHLPLPIDQFEFVFLLHFDFDWVSFDSSHTSTQTHSNSVRFSSTELKLIFYCFIYDDNNIFCWSELTLRWILSHFSFCFGLTNSIMIDYTRSTIEKCLSHYIFFWMDHNNNSNFVEFTPIIQHELVTAMISDWTNQTFDSLCATNRSWFQLKMV